MSPDLAVLPFPLSPLPSLPASAGEGEPSTALEGALLELLNPGGVEGVQVLRLLALQRAHQDRREEAVGLFLTVLALLPAGSARATVRLEWAKTLAAFDRHEEAIAAYEQCQLDLEDDEATREAGASLSAPSAPSAPMLSVEERAIRLLVTGLAATGRALSLAAARRPEEALHALPASVSAESEALLGMQATQTLRLARETAYARIALALHRPLDALTAIGPVVERAPDDREALLIQAAAFLSLHRPMQAVAAIERLLARLPDDPPALVLFGQALSSLGEFAYAVDRFEHALALAPSFAPAYRYMASALVMQKLDEEALNCLRAARRVRPDWPDAWLDEAGIRLRRGQLLRGFAAYEWRDGVRLAARQGGQAFWNGDDGLEGQSIFVLAEQGLGDTLHFIRYLPLIAAMARHVTVEVQAPLLRLVRASAEDWGVDVIARGDARPPCDRYTLLMSLPHALQTRLDTVPATIPYVKVSAHPTLRTTPEVVPDLVAGLRSSIDADALNGGNLPRRWRVGIVPSGNPEYQNDAMRSMPLAALAPVLELSDIDAVLLQPTAREADRLWMMENPSLIAPMPPSGDFLDTATYLDAIDLVITVDTAMAHLAGALGKPVWVMLPYVSDWRWLDDRLDSPWYPTARLFRQTIALDWSRVVQDIRDALIARRCS